MVSSDFLRIVYELERMPGPEPDLDQLDAWSVTLQHGTMTDDDDEPAWHDVASAVLYGMDPHRNVLLGQSPFDVADAHSADTLYYFEHVFDRDGNFLPDVEEQFEHADGRALFLQDVRVLEEHQRHGYGSLLVAETVLTLAPHGTAVFAHPGPTDPDLDEGDAETRFRRETQNTRFLGALGFEPFRDRLWTLDLSAGDGLGTLARIRQRTS